MEAAGSYERLDYYRNQQLFSLDGSSNFSATLDQFTNFFQNYTFSISSSDQLPSVYEVTSIGSDGESNNTVSVLAVQYGMILIIVTVAIIRYTLIQPRPPSKFFLTLSSILRKMTVSILCVQLSEHLVPTLP